jgi:transposase
VLLLDNVRYHHTNTVMELLSSLSNITFKYLPPYSADLNAIEHLWKDIRKSVTHNHLFESVKYIVKAITKYFMNVQRTPTKVKRLCPFIY